MTTAAAMLVFAAFLASAVEAVKALTVEGAGIAWPGTDLAILGIFAFLTLVSLDCVAMLRRMRGLDTALAVGVFAKGE